MRQGKRKSTNITEEEINESTEISKTPAKGLQAEKKSDLFSPEKEITFPKRSKRRGNGGDNKDSEERRSSVSSVISLVDGNASTDDENEDEKIQKNSTKFANGEKSPAPIGTAKFIDGSQFDGNNLQSTDKTGAEEEGEWASKNNKDDDGDDDNGDDLIIPQSILEKVAEAKEEQEKTEIIKFVKNEQKIQKYEAKLDSNSFKVPDPSTDSKLIPEFVSRCESYSYTYIHIYIYRCH